VRKHLLTASATLAALISFAVVDACGGATASNAPAASGTTCINAKAAHKAYVVVTHLDGKSVERCVGFDGDQINGDDLMTQSGLQVQAQQFSFGKAICQIDQEPASFTDCFPKNQPYWSLYTETAGGPWQQAQTGYTAINLKSGDGLGWRYTPAAASPAPLPSPVKT
jgi:hypothetical protein